MSNLRFNSRSRSQRSKSMLFLFRFPEPLHCKEEFSKHPWASYPLHLIILHFQMFPVGISSKHTRPLVNAFGPPFPEFVQQGTFTIKMFSILSWLKRPSHHWVGKGRDVILTAGPRCSLPSSTQLSRSPPSTVTVWFFLLTPERIEYPTPIAVHFFLDLRIFVNKCT